MIRYASCVWELPMPTTFRAYQPDQPLLLPPDLQEWVPPGHLAHHVSDVVDALDLTAFYAPYEGDARRNAPYEPSMMVKVLIYAYATGTFSSRAAARKLEEDVAFRMLAAGNFPQHRTYVSSDADMWRSSASCFWGWCRWRARWDWRGSAVVRRPSLTPWNQTISMGSHADRRRTLEPINTRGMVPALRRRKTSRIRVGYAHKRDRCEKRSDLATRQTNRQSDQPGKRVRHTVNPTNFSA